MFTKLSGLRGFTNFGCQFYNKDQPVNYSEYELITVYANNLKFQSFYLAQNWNQLLSLAITSLSLQ